MTPSRFVSQCNWQRGTLGEVVRAIAAHQRVKAEGFATVESVGPPATLDAIGVEFELSH